MSTICYVPFVRLHGFYTRPLGVDESKLTIIHRDNRVLYANATARSREESRLVWVCLKQRSCSPAPHRGRFLSELIMNPPNKSSQLGTTCESLGKTLLNSQVQERRGIVHISRCFSPIPYAPNCQCYTPLLPKTLAMSEQQENTKKSESMPGSPAQEDLFIDENDQEIVIAWVCPVGTETDTFEEQLSEALTEGGFSVADVIKLIDLLESKFTAESKEEFSDFHSIDYYDKTRCRQKAGNALREATNPSILALLGIDAISEKRKQLAGKKRAYILHSLKHPSEAILLREVYGDAFFLIGVYNGYENRFAYLKGKCEGDESKATELIDLDDYQTEKFGQRTRDVFELCDAYLKNDASTTRADLDRIIDLILGAVDRVPSVDEYAMAIAYDAAARSGDLARQVGAAVLNDEGDVLATGRNDVPKAGGGLYRYGDVIDASDYAIGKDGGQAYRETLIQTVSNHLQTSVIEILTNEFEKLPKQDLQVVEESRKEPSLWNKESILSDIRLKVAQTSLKDLIEYGRSVHAEMDAILTCCRNGISTVGKSLYVTTFPCHTCCRHIIAAGVKHVVYLEPYPKSKALSLHCDAVDCDAMKPEYLVSKKQNTSLNRIGGDKTVLFTPFVGVGPRRYKDFFEMRNTRGAKIERKHGDGQAVEFKRSPTNELRLQASMLNIIQREDLARKVGRSVQENAV